MPIIGGTTLTQSSFRFRNDDGSETTATWSAAQDTDFNPAVSTLFRIRFEVKASSSASGLSTAFLLRYSLNGGTYTDVAAQGATSDPVRYANSANITDNEATTEQLAGSGTFLAGACDENGNTGTISFPTAARDTELEFVVEIYSGMVTGGDTIDLRVYRASGTALNNYTVTPRMTIPASDETNCIRWYF